MTKPALAAMIALALSIPLADLSAGAQSSSASTKSESKAQTTSTGVQSTFSAPQQANRSRPAQIGNAPTTWSTTQSGTRGSTATVTTTTTSSTTAASTAATSTTTTAATKTDDSVIVTQSVPRVSPPGAGTKPAWQKFYDYIKLKAGQDSVPLTLTVTNGNANHPAFQAVQLFLSGQKLASEKDFKGNVLNLKMDGTLTAGGDNQLIIQAYGPPNAAISWKLTTQRAVITAVTPDTAGIGDAIKITGRNFSNKTGVSQVWIGDKLATITSGNNKTLMATIPPNALSGENKVNVAIAGIAAKPGKITIKSAAPELTSTDIYGAPPGYTMTVTGKGFSDKASDNVVTVGGVTASITGCSTTSISFLMPELPNVWSAVPLVVKTKNVASKNTLNVQPSNRLLPSSN